MTTGWKSWTLSTVGCLVIGSEIASSTESVLAQITLDTTLGNENSSFTSTGTVDIIDGGATRGANLFHSFQEFNVGEGRAAVFTNPIGIENILTRVTGGRPSDILGTLGVAGNANLFLMNPNGIIFGPNARLDIGGSFIGTTANAIGLANRDIFNANSAEPLPSQLLNVNPNAFFFNQIATQAIINRSTANSAGLEVPQGRSLLLVGGDVRLEGGQIFAPGGRVELGGLASPGSVGLSIKSSQESLSFPDNVQRANVLLTNGSEVDVTSGSGGSIAINAQNLDILRGSSLDAGIQSGLGSVDSQAGNITLNATEEMVVNEASTVTNSVRSEATGNGGNINITSGSLLVTEGAVLSASTYGQGDAGSINIKARDTVSFNGEGIDGFPSSARSAAELGAVGNGGNIEITAGSLSVTKGSELVVLTRVQGDAGSININARDTVSFDGKRSNGFLSVASSTVEGGAEGNGGNINITTGSLLVTDGGLLNASTYGQGGAGTVNVNAQDTVSFDGEGAALSFVERKAMGNSGNINIQTGSLFVKSGAALSTSTRGKGNAGSININARDTVSFDGVGRKGFSSGASSIVGSSEAVGNSGSINIQTGALFVKDGASLSTSTSGKGNAGSININARDTVSFDGVGRNRSSSAAISSVALEGVGNGNNINIQTGSIFLTNGAILSASTRGKGNAGSININARDTISFDGVGSNNNVSSGARSSVESQGVGNGGSIDIQTGSLSVTNGALLLAITLDKGNAGSININARDTISFDGVGSDRTSSGARSSVGLQAMGNGGSIDIQTGSLLVTNGAQLLVRSQGKGNAGSLSIKARDTVSFDGVGSNGTPSGARSSVESQGVGNGGSIDIQTGSLLVTNGASLLARSQGSNNAAGDIVVGAGSIRLDNQALLSADTVAGQGNIFLRSKNLTLRRGSNITTNAAGTAIGGNITINTDVLVALENSDITADAEEAFGGQVIINAQGIFGTQFRESETPQSDITATSELGTQFTGTVEINTPDIDPSNGLVSLPTIPVDTEVAQACTPGSGQANSEFVVTGRGGLPPTPTEALNPDAIAVDWVTLQPEGKNNYNAASSTSPTTPESKPIVEAQGWIINHKGEVVLTASAPTATPHSSWQTLANCTS